VQGWDVSKEGHDSLDVRSGSTGLASTAPKHQRFAVNFAKQLHALALNAAISIE
jgi:hypothetical protein